MRLLFFVTLVFFSITSLIAQELKVSAELKPRFEARHGFGTLASPDDEAALYVSQRSRLSIDFATDKYEVLFEIQNVGVWGDVSTLSPNDKNGTSFHQAWGMYHFSPHFSVKLGRQEIALDDERIFGAVDWAQQARSHDALVLKTKPGNKSKLDLGFALNANRETYFEEDYLVNQYKSLQYAWFHTDFSSGFGLSLFFLNNGMPYDHTDNNNVTKQNTTYSQTFGGRLTFSKDWFNLNAASYYQGGSTPNSAKNEAIDFSAFYVTANANFNVLNDFSVGTGFELFSGNDQDGPNDENNAFNPFYGTNHKYNGWMDYFYVGNHIDNIGLFDMYIPVSFQRDKLELKLIPHFFSSQGNILTPNFQKADAYLGTEIDFQVSYELVKNVMLLAGYSQMFATESMEYLKGGSKNETNNWAWMMITFKPTLFNKKFEPENM